MAHTFTDTDIAAYVAAQLAAAPRVTVIPPVDPDLLRPPTYTGRAGLQAKDRIASRWAPMAAASPFVEAWENIVYGRPRPSAALRIWRSTNAVSVYTYKPDHTDDCDRTGLPTRECAHCSGSTLESAGFRYTAHDGRHAHCPACRTAFVADLQAHRL